jgi:hypothetical protein|tara:strand:+ start:20805 stop:20987 length:183 start_codon:yes stop_codon:yes gene_type:complete
MNRRIAKKLRAIVNPQDEVSKRVYKRLKKQYLSLSKEARPVFLEEVDYFLNGEKEQLDDK